jgi:hypothetical protein
MDAMLEVRSGMQVVDAAGEELGTVEDFKMGDEQAATAEGQTTGRDGGLLEGVAYTFARDDREMSDEQRQRLLRIGYIKVDGAGLFGGHFYIAADRIDRVEGDTVHLSGTGTGLE